MNKNPFVLPLKPRWLGKTIEALLGLNTLAAFYESWLRDSTNVAAGSVSGVQQFLKYGLDCIGIHVKPSHLEGWSLVPKEGPVLVVSNHPLGGAEGMAMTEQLLSVRPDLLVLTNEILTKVPELETVFVGVNVLSSTAQSRNAKGIKVVLKHIQNGGAVLMYPSGIVSATNPATGEVEDPEWNRVAGMLARRSKATVLPCFVDAKNSAHFYLAGRIHPRLRTVLLIREMLNKHGSVFPVHIGAPIKHTEYQHLVSDRDITLYFRLACDALRKPEQCKEVDTAVSDTLEQLDIPPSTKTPDQIAQQLADLTEYELVRHGDLAAFCVPYDRLGLLLSEIACARERTFREVGEGSGKAFDSDRFDPYYQHLFVWDFAKHQLVGGYRLGRVDEILEDHGVDDLYSRSLYDFDEAYVRSLGQSLEVGRSFVTPEYQRHPRALDMLWQGIGRYVALHPEYHLLFGCVSISNDYSHLARAFLSESMMSSFRAHQAYLNDIKPRKPLQVKGRIWTPEILASLTNIAVINQLVGRIDSGKAVPVLLRHYLALNGRFIGFSVNEQFQDSLDGLIVVDLRETPVKYLNRYLSKDGAQRFLQKWEKTNAVA